MTSVQVTLVSLPLSNGVAVASGAPPTTTIISLPGNLTRTGWPVVLIGATGQFLVFFLDSTRIAALKRLPPALIRFAPDDSGWNQGFNHN